MREEVRKILEAELLATPSEDFDKNLVASVHNRVLERKIRKTKVLFGLASCVCLVMGLWVLEELPSLFKISDRVLAFIICVCAGLCVLLFNEIKNLLDRERYTKEMLRKRQLFLAHHQNSIIDRQ